MKRTLLLGALLVAACGGTATSETEQTKQDGVGLAGNALARPAFDRLVAKTGGHWEIAQHALFGTTSHLEGSAPSALLPSGNGYESSLAFLAENKDLFSMRAPAAELRLTRERTDSLGMRHVRMQQVIAGIRVVDAEVTAHFDQKGALVTVDARYVPNLDKLDLTPALDAKAALAIAIADATAGRANIGTSPTEPELVVFADGVSAPRLAYFIRVRADGGGVPQIFVYAIDAKTGAIANRYDDIKTMAGTGKGVKGDTKAIQVTQQNGQYALVDSSRTPNNITTYSASNSQNSPGAIVTSSVATSWDTATTGAPGSAVDAHFNAGVVYDYYKKTHGRSGIDGQDGAIISTVHFAQQYDNAFWDGTQMVYGDGDGQEFYGFAAGLDVVGHELTHGVTQNESNLTYQGQSGALNESISDIMGCLVEHYGLPDPVKNWELGENISPTPTRDMVHPSKGQQPANMSEFVNTSQDNGGVHINSGIPNNAAYLMTMGGTNDKSNTKVAFGIGYEKSEKLWYLTNTQYLQSGADFAAAAAATASAAKSLNFTQNEINIVACAWIAVGVTTGTCETLTDPAPVTGGGTGGTGTGDNTGNTGGGRTPSTGSGSGTGSGSTGSGSSSSSGGDGTGSSTGSSSSNYGDGRGFANTSSGGCAVTKSTAPDAGSFAVFGLALAAVARLRNRRRRAL